MMKFAIIGIIGFAMLGTAAIIMSTPSPRPCAISHNTSMGNSVEPGPTGRRLIWDMDCASGMRWVK